jgi:hypothetical protein
MNPKIEKQILICIGECDRKLTLKFSETTIFWGKKVY